MKAFLKNYWLESLLFAVGMVGALIAFPFLPGSVPLQWHDGEVTTTGPKWVLILVPLVQLAVTVVFHWWIQHSLSKFPGVGTTLSGMEKLLPLILAVVVLTLELCIMLAAWGVAVRLEMVLVVELLLVPIVVIGFVAAKILSNISNIK
ncbi:MAG: DUF1648 domain-containing protein [Acutalibacter sp.]